MATKAKPRDSERARLTVGANLWVGEDDHEQQLVETERTDSDEVKIAVEDVGIYFSREAAEEIGRQMIARAQEEWG